MQQHERWLEQAKSDLGFARIGLKEHYFSQVCFLSQQVVEKTLKALIISKNLKYPRSHKIIELLKYCEEIKEPLSDMKTDLKLLDEFYIPTRYPDSLPGSLAEGVPMKDEAKLAFKTAERVFKIVSDYLNY
ncbi:MAG: HEPN domain-containing protein [Elusimicrobiota bacterium]